MADREDSVHIKIRIDVDPQDKAFIENLSSDMARADESIITQKQTLGPPTKTQWESQQLEKEIKKIQDDIKRKKGKKTDQEVKKELESKKNSLLLKQFKAGPVGIVHGFSKEQTANLSKFVSNPGAFFIAGLTKILGKYGKGAAKGGIYAIIAILIYDTVLFVIDQLMQPGRMLDRRFKRLARIETMNFYERTLQEEIRHGYQEIRITTMQGLRGGASQVNGNFFEFSSGTTGLLQTSPYRNSQDIYQSQSSTGSITDSQGSPRRRTISGRFG